MLKSAAKILEKEMFKMNNKIKNKWMVINNFKNIINNTYAVNYIGDVINLKTNKLLHKKNC